MPTIYTTTTWKFHTASEKVKVKCCKCGKTITKTVSVQYREDCKPDYVYLNQKKQELLQQTHICSKCEKAAVEDTKVYGKLDIQEDLSNVSKQMSKVREQDIILQEIINNISTKLKDKVILYKDREYVYRNIVSADTFCSYDYVIRANQINKRQPWLITDNRLEIYSKVTNSGDTWCSIEDVTITEENFSERRKRHDEALK